VHGRIVKIDAAAVLPLVDLAVVLPLPLSHRQIDEISLRLLSLVVLSLEGEEGVVLVLERERGEVVLPGH